MSVFILLMVGLPAHAQAQKSEGAALFEHINDVAKQNMSSTASERLAAINDHAFSKDVSFVRLPERLYEHQSFSMYLDRSGKLNRGNNRSGTLVHAVNDTIIASNTGHLTWIGHIMINDDPIGKISLTQDKYGEVTGAFSIDDLSMQIRALGNGNHALYVQDLTALNKLQREAFERRQNDNNKRGNSRSPHHKPDHPNQGINKPQSLEAGDGSTYSRSETLNINQTLSTMNSGTNVINVAVFYTSNAAQGNNVSSIVAAAIAETNDAYSNSNISNIVLNLYKLEALSISESGNIINDLQNFENIANLGNADIAVLLTGSFYGSTKGRTSQILADKDSRHAIVDINHAVGGNMWFAHEVGHLQGAQHHPDHVEDESIGPEWARGRRFIYRVQWGWWQRRSTIMAYDWKGWRPYNWTTVPHFSNPNVIYRGGEATGTSEKRNAHYMVQTASHVASLGGVPLLASISGTINAHTGSGTLTAQTQGGTGSYSYEWRWSNPPWSGNNYLIGTNQQLSFNFPPGDNMLRLFVTSGDDTYEAVRYFYVMMGGTFAMTELDKELPVEKGDQTDVTYETGFNAIYPNPFNPATQITIGLEQQSHVNVRVYDMLGRLVTTLQQGELSDGVYRFTFDASSLSSGTYMVRMTTDDKEFTRQISLMK